MNLLAIGISDEYTPIERESIERRTADAQAVAHITVPPNGRTTILPIMVRP